MKVRVWGVRGSIPAPGPETNRYGGNTSCVSVTTDDGHLVIIDLGTGLVGLGDELMKGSFGSGEGVATILLSHGHWDHIQGFPFFVPAFIPGNEFCVFGYARSSEMLEGILEGQMNPHFSPLYTLKNLAARIGFSALVPGEVTPIHDVSITAQPNPHGTTTALAFRLEQGGRSFVYASDVGYPDGGPTDEMLALYHGADVLLHDCTYTPEDQSTRRNRGFSSYVDAASAAIKAGAKHLVMFHYDQDYSDDKVDSLFTACRKALDDGGGSHIELTAAAEGTEINLAD